MLAAVSLHPISAGENIAAQKKRGLGQHYGSYHPVCKVCKDFFVHSLARRPKYPNGVLCDPKRESRFQRCVAAGMRADLVNQQMPGMQKRSRQRGSEGLFAHHLMPFGCAVCDADGNRHLPSSDAILDMFGADSESEVATPDFVLAFTADFAFEDLLHPEHLEFGNNAVADDANNNNNNNDNDNDNCTSV